MPAGSVSPTPLGRLLRATADRERGNEANEERERGRETDSRERGMVRSCTKTGRTGVLLAKRKRSHDAAINTLRHLQLTFTGVQTRLSSLRERERESRVSLPDCQESEHRGDSLTLVAAYLNAMIPYRLDTWSVRLASALNTHFNSDQELIKNCGVISD